MNESNTELIALIIGWMVPIILVIAAFVINLYVKYRIRNPKKDPYQIRVSEKTFTEWLDADEQSGYGVCDPPMDAQMAMDYLFDYLNCSPVTVSESTKQCNTAILFEILMRYSPEFRKEYDQWRKKP